MRRAAPILLGAVLLVALVGSAARVHNASGDLPSIPSPGGATVDQPRFAFVNAYIDSKDQPLAAYQFELTAQGAGVTLVGVEGGDHPAYAEPPYYDPKANLQNRIVIAAFNTGENLPRGRTRVARVMIRIIGSDPVWSAKLDVAASPDAKPIDATIQVSEGATP